MSDYDLFFVNTVCNQAGVFMREYVDVFLLDGLHYGNLTFSDFSSISRGTGVILKGDVT